MSVSQHDWSLHRKGQIDQERHKEKIREAVKKIWVRSLARRI